MLHIDWAVPLRPGTRGACILTGQDSFGTYRAELQLKEPLWSFVNITTQHHRPQHLTLDDDIGPCFAYSTRYSINSY